MASDDMRHYVIHHVIMSYHLRNPGRYMFLGWVQEIAPYSQEILLTLILITLKSSNIIHDKQDIGKRHQRSNLFGRSSSIGIFL